MKKVFAVTMLAVCLCLALADNNTSIAVTPGAQTNGSVVQLYDDFHIPMDAVQCAAQITGQMNSQTQISLATNIVDETSVAMTTSGPAAKNQSAAIQGEPLYCLGQDVSMVTTKDVGSLFQTRVVQKEATQNQIASYINIGNDISSNVQQHECEQAAAATDIVIIAQANKTWTVQTIVANCS